MKRQTPLFLFITLIFILSGRAATAQECFGTKIKEGSGFEMTSFNGKGKPTGTLHYKFAQVGQEGGYTVVEIEMESFSEKGKSQGKQKLKMRCNGNESLIDAGSLIMEDQRKNYDSYNMKFTSQDIVYPNQYNVGQTLKEASLKGSGDMSGMPITLEMDLTDRKVMAKENITVGAGTFDAYKITATNKVVSKTVIPVKVQFETVSYRAPGVIWDIKSETYSRGKLVGSTELTKFF